EHTPEVELDSVAQRHVLLEGVSDREIRPELGQPRDQDAMHAPGARAARRLVLGARDLLDEHGARARPFKRALDGAERIEEAVRTGPHAVGPAALDVGSAREVIEQEAAEERARAFD